MNILPVHSPRRVSDSFVERRAGFILAVCLHVMLFASLAMQERLPVIDPRPTPLRQVHIQLAPPPVELALQPTQEVMPQLADIPQEGGAVAENPAPESEISETGEPTEWAKPLPVNAMGETVSPVADSTESAESAAHVPEAIVAAPVETAEGSEALQARLAALRRKLDGKRAEALSQPDEQDEARIDATAEEGSDVIAERLKLLDVDMKAQETLFRSKGTHAGVIRSLVLTGVDRVVSQQVMARYGIRIIPIHGAQTGGRRSKPGYLTSATTGDGQFVQGTGRGNFLKFIISRQAGMRMMQLEAEALEARGFDPAKARLIEVEFGVVPTIDGYDLGVRKMLAEALPDAGDYEKP